jgi:hypothetical protein
MGGGDGQNFKRFLEDEGVEMKSEFRRLRELSDPEFRGDFPSRGGADKDGIGSGTDEFAGGARKGGIVGEPPEQSMSIQEKAQRSLQSFEFVLRKRLKEFGADRQFPFHAAGFALAFFFAERLEANQRLVAAGDNDFFSFAGFRNEAREMGFRVVNLDRRHIS